MEPAALPDREFTLFEYQPCWDTDSDRPDPDRIDALFDRRTGLQPYLAQGWLTRSFVGDRPCLRASHYVGVLPFLWEDRPQLLLIAPKGCRSDPRVGLLRFLELLFLGEGDAVPEAPPGWHGRLGAHPFLLFLAGHYARLLGDLCRRDFRSYYRPEEGDLRGHLKGRLDFPRHVRAVLRGQAHVLPCRWEEFTVDNWDNRILWAAARRLVQVAAALAPEAAASVSRRFQPLLPWFSAVADVPVSPADFRKSKLGRTSRCYRDALTWAQLLLRGGDLPSAAGQAPPLVLNTNDAFERFAKVVVQSALPGHGWRATRLGQKESVDFLIEGQVQLHHPDIIVSSEQGTHAVGDAKYKDVLERSTGVGLESGEVAVRVGIQPSDWNQLYVYMRLTGARCGFFVVPFWKIDGQPCTLLEPFRFAVPPCDGIVRVAVLGLNLLRPLRDVREAAADRFRAWLSEACQ